MSAQSCCPLQFEVLPTQRLAIGGLWLEGVKLWFSRNSQYKFRKIWPYLSEKNM